MPAVFCRRAVRTGQTTFGGVFGKNAKITESPSLAALLQQRGGAVHGSTTCHDGCARRGGGLFCEDVDDAVDRVGSPNGTAGTTDHFYLCNLLEWDIENFVKDAAERRHVHCSAIDHDQNFVAESPVEAADADGPTASVDLRDLHARHHTEQVGMLVAPER